MVTAARRHLTIAHATGVERLLWDTEKRPMPDLDAVQAVISPHKANQPVEALDIGAALILVQEMRLEVDCLEAEVLAAALDSGLGLESLAAVLELPGPAAMLARLEYLRRPPVPRDGRELPRHRQARLTRDSRASRGRVGRPGALRCAQSDFWSITRMMPLMKPSSVRNGDAAICRSTVLPRRLIAVI